MSLVLKSLIADQKQMFGPRIGRYLPPALVCSAMQVLLNQVLQEQLANGALDILQDRWLGIECLQWPYRLRVGLKCKKILVDCEQSPCDAVIKGDYQSFLALLQQKVDPDTLFFKRKLISTGDTELALAIKNFLDTLEWADLPKPLRLVIDHLP